MSSKSVWMGDLIEEFFWMGDILNFSQISFSIRHTLSLISSNPNLDLTSGILFEWHLKILQVAHFWERKLLPKLLLFSYEYSSALQAGKKRKTLILFIKGHYFVFEQISTSIVRVKQFSQRDKIKMKGKIILKRSF